MGKKKRILGIVLLLVIVILVVIGLSLDQIVRVGASAAATDALGVATRIGGANLSLLRGAVALKKLQVDNPPDYADDHFLTVRSCAADADVGSIFTDTIVIESVDIEGLVLSIEQKGLTSNLQTILDQLPKSDKPKDPSASAKRLIIDRLEIINPVARIKLTPIPGSTADIIELKLADIKLEKISDETGAGQLSAQVIQNVLAALAEAIVNQGVDVLPGQLRNQLSNAVGSVQQALNQAAQTMVQDAQKAVEAGAEDVKTKAQNLLKNPGKLLDAPGSKPKEK